LHSIEQHALNTKEMDLIFTSAPTRNWIARCLSHLKSLSTERVTVFLRLQQHIHMKPTRKFEIVFIWTDRAKCVRHNGIINSVAANKTHLTLALGTLLEYAAPGPHIWPLSKVIC